MATKSSNFQLGVQGVPGVDGSESLMMGESSMPARFDVIHSCVVCESGCAVPRKDPINTTAQPRKLETPNYNYNIHSVKLEIRTCNSTKTQCLIKKRRANILRPRDISGIFPGY